MCLTKTIERIQYMDYLIRIERTGCARQLAEQIGVSERTVFKYLSEFRVMGAPVSWSSSANSYIYYNSVKFIFGFRSENPPEQDKMKHFIQSDVRNPGRQEIFINN